MRDPLIPSLVLVAASLSLAASAGCYNTAGDCNLFNCGTGGAAGSTTSSTAGGDGGTGASTPDGCVPKDAPGPVADGCGVFVSPSGDDSGLGTKASPVQTIATAILRAKEGEKRIYACADVFSAALDVDAGVTIFGGLDCAADWSYSPIARTVLTSDPDTVPLHLAAAVPLAMSDVDVTAADAALAGGSSIAIIAESMASLSLTRSTVTAGVAMAGEDGASFSSTAMDGATGSTGADACLAAQAITSPAPVNRCGDIDSAGGSGGLSEAIQGSAGNAGLPLITDNGGAGEVAAACKLGTAGTDGTNGEAGEGATGMGILDAAGYTGVAGKDGFPGTTAQGGGGGGGSKGGSGSGKCADATKASGASGGSGGSGGCGGQGGRGGKPGGSSIGLASLGATIVFGGDVTIIAKTGGKGGSGSDGQTGGIGAPGGNGGAVPGSATLLKAGCKGGPGGAGGTGGKGGGGHGGHSIAVAYTGAPPETTGAVLFIGSAGEGGLGDGAISGTEGEKGVAVKVQLF